jgi:hypothetical protein
MFASGLQKLADRINQSYPDSVRIDQIMQMLNEPQLRSINKDDVTYALQAAGIMDFMESSVSAPDYNPARGGYHNNRSKIESALRDMAEKYQAALAGMYHEDPSDIAANMEELAAEYGIDVEDYFNESINVVSIKEWLKKRAGIV